MAFLRMNTGKEFPCGAFSCPSDFALVIRIDMTMQDLLTVFQDPDETIDMCWIDNLGHTIRTAHGFTEFKGFEITGGEYPMRVHMAKKVPEV